jgi:hypothetical protein
MLEIDLEDPMQAEAYAMQLAALVEMAHADQSGQMVVTVINDMTKDEATALLFCAVLLMMDDEDFSL